MLVLVLVPLWMRRPLGSSALGITGHRAGAVAVAANTDAQAREHVPRVVRELCSRIDRIESHHRLVQLQPELALSLVQVADRGPGFVLAAFALWGVGLGRTTQKWKDRLN